MDDNTISIIGQSLPAISFQNMTLSQSKQKSTGVEKHYSILRWELEMGTGTEKNSESYSAYCTEMHSCAEGGK